MLATSKLNSTTMGAIDPVVARNHARIKSASIEASNQPGTRLTRSSYEFDEIEVPIESDNNKFCRATQSIDGNANNDDATNFKCNSLIKNNNSFHSKAKKLLTLTPAPLKPSVSTSCLVTNEDSGSSSNALTCIPTRASLTHEWKKLKTPNKCRECNLLVYFNGRECSFCGFVAHKKCVTILVIKCSGQQLSGLGRGRKEKNSSLSNSAQSSRKSRPVVQPIFGQPICVDSHQVVDFMRRFIYEIDSRGLTSRGIYRVSSIKSKVDRLCNYYDQNLSSLVDLSSFHPNVIANALKMYLRQLPEPLFTQQLYHQFIEIAKKYPHSTQASTSSLANETTSKTQTPAHKPRRPYTLSLLTSPAPVNNNPNYNPLLIVELREIIELLPPINQSLIAIIMRHLKRVADMSEENQMSAKNLSIIFGPTLMSAEDNKSLAIVDNIHQARVVELMITWADQIFPQYANYESKAVIELDLTDVYDANGNLTSSNNQQQQHVRQHPPDCMCHNRQKDKSVLGRASELINNQEKNFVKNLVATHTKGKDSKKIKNSDDKEMKNNIELPQQQQQTKTRNDLRELRRQFFTVPSSTAQQETTSTGAVSTDLGACTGNSQQTTSDRANNIFDKIKKSDNSNHKPSRSQNPPGSVPVIKVQAYYCNTLTKQDEDKR